MSDEDLINQMRIAADGTTHNPELLRSAADAMSRMTFMIAGLRQVAGAANVDGGPTFRQMRDAKFPDSETLGKFVGEN